MRRLTPRNAAFINRGIATVSPPSDDIPFACSSPTDLQHSSAATRFAENIPSTKATDKPLGEARGPETKPLSDFARAVR
jgi:hypothetical protein